ncbi:peptidoglycan-binding domain-containing protein [Clostridium cibarium]|uniref:Peptidoglycan-binding protein n=1 Tax=Clostridium cibarium TaxID=2762247 RepID=A0ABR8PTG3_9CLOT|nr:peptidoglycan-binding domain-containing protein [Clostridium cibarium]MBD7911437.1 peptidoglycan-binding protein [Clostridium cibarium]
MKNLKIKLLSLSVLGITLISSTPIWAATNNTTISANKVLATATINYPEATCVDFYESSGIVEVYGTNQSKYVASIYDYIGDEYTNQGGSVVGLQLALNHYLHRNLATDGYFGELTRSALKTFQGNHGLNPDGICGPSTWRALATEIL